MSNTGRIIDADKLLMSFAKDILPDKPGATVVFDVKSSNHLFTLIEDLKGIPLMCKSGHSYVRKALTESEAVLGGEYSAHIFFKHRWFGFDDGMYSACRFVELVDKHHSTADSLIENLPTSANTPELFIPTSEQDKFYFMDKLKTEMNFQNAEVNSLDGLRISWPEGWALIRASDTTPNLVMRFEANNAEALEDIMLLFRNELLRILPKLSLPF